MMAVYNLLCKFMYVPQSPNLCSPGLCGKKYSLFKISIREYSC